MKDLNNKIHWYGMDIDGTITNINDSRKLIVSPGIHKNPIKLFLLRRALKKIIPTIWPAVNYVHFITARPWFLKKATLEWLNYWKLYYAKRGYTVPKYIMTSHPSCTLRTHKAVAEWKANIINESNIKIYYEDNEEIRKILYCKCPETLILKETVTLSDGTCFKPYGRNLKK